MHPSAMDFLHAAILEQDVSGKRILEVGSFDVNGSPRSVIDQFGPAEYIGVDMRMGPGVDVVCNAADLLGAFEPESFDMVISTEMMEHAEDWRAAIYNIKALCKPGGIVIITARGPGFQYHPEETAEGFYGDYWRFKVTDMEQIFADFDIINCHRDPTPGVLFKGRKPMLETYGQVDLSKIEVDRIIG